MYLYQCTNERLNVLIKYQQETLSLLSEEILNKYISDCSNDHYCIILCVVWYGIKNSEE